MNAQAEAQARAEDILPLGSPAGKLYAKQREIFSATVSDHKTVARQLSAKIQQARDEGVLPKGFDPAEDEKLQPQRLTKVLALRARGLRGGR